LKPLWEKEHFLCGKGRKSNPKPWIPRKFALNELFECYSNVHSYLPWGSTNRANSEERITEKEREEGSLAGSGNPLYPPSII